MNPNNERKTPYDPFEMRTKYEAFVLEEFGRPLSPFEEEWIMRQAELLSAAYLRGVADATADTGDMVEQIAGFHAFIDESPL